MNPLKLVFIGIIKLYRLFLSPWVGWHCRFDPTCSRYAEEAIKRHGACRGGLACRKTHRAVPSVGRLGL